MEDKVLTKVPAGMEIVKSEAGNLTGDQWDRFFNNTLKFSVVPVLAFLVAIQGGMSIEQAFSLALVPALINSLIDLITKWNTETPYLRKK